MKRLTALLLFLYVQWPVFNGQCSANDGVYYTSGNFLVPVKETDISAKKEVLEITLCKDGFADVTVDYTFYNNSDPKTVTMAFEAAAPYNADEPLNRQGIHPNIQNFTVLFRSPGPADRSLHVVEVLREADARRQPVVHGGHGEAPFQGAGQDADDGAVPPAA